MHFQKSIILRTMNVKHEQNSFEKRMLFSLEFISVHFSSVAQSYPTFCEPMVCNMPCVGLPCPSPTPRAYSKSCLLSWWCHPTISSSVVPISSHLQSFPASGSFQMSQFLASGGQRIGVSALASLPPMNIQDLFPSELAGCISLQSKGLSRVFSNTTVQKNQLFGTQPSLYGPTLTFIHDSWKNHSFE